MASGTTALTVGTGAASGTSLTLAGANTFTGDILVNGGTLNANFNGGTTSPLGGQNGTSYRTMTLQNGGVFNSLERGDE